MFGNTGFVHLRKFCKKQAAQYDNADLAVYTHCKQPLLFKKCRSRKERDRCGELKRIVSTTAKGETRQGEQGKVMRRKERKDEIL